MEPLHSLIEKVYAAAEDPAAWSPLLEDFADAVHAAQTAIIFQNRVTHVGTVGAMARIDPAWVALYESHYVAENFYLVRSAPFLKSGAINVSQTFIDDADVVKTRYYNEYLRPQDIFHSADCVIAHDDDWSANLITTRRRDAGYFGEPELEIMRTLMPHLQRAFRVHRKLSTMSAENRLLSGVADSLATGVLFLNEQRKLIHATDPAKRILERGDGLTMREGVLVGSDRDAQAALDRLLQGISSADSFAPNVSRIPRKDSFSCYVVTAVKPRESDPSAPSEVKALVYIDDPDEERTPAFELVQTLFGATRAEACFAIQLLAGKTMSEVAGIAGITHNTARTHIKQLLAKTGTHRQAELMRLLERTLGRHSAYKRES